MSARLGAELLDATVLSAGYWQKHGHASDNHADITMFFDNAINHWKNAAYAMAEKVAKQQLEIDNLNAIINEVTSK